MMQKLKDKFEETELVASTAAMSIFASMGKDEYASAASDPFRMDSRAQAGASRATNLVVGIVVAGLMGAFLFPIAIDELESVNTTDWDGGAASLWGILPVILVLALFLFFVGMAMRNN